MRRSDAIGWALLAAIADCASTREAEPQPAPAAPSTSQAIASHAVTADADSAAQALAVSRPAASTRPTSSPGTRRADTPPPAESRPAGVPAFLPLEDAVAGEWVEYAAMEGHRLRYEILRVGPGVVAVQVGVRAEHGPIGLPAMREELRDLDPLARTARADQAHRSMRPAKVTAAGREWDALLYEDHWTDEDGISYRRHTWVSRQAPVYGMLRMELHGDGRLEAQLELRAFGRNDMQP